MEAEDFSIDGANVRIQTLDAKRRRHKRVVNVPVHRDGPNGKLLYEKV